MSFLTLLWLALTRFLSRFFNRHRRHSSPDLPLPVTIPQHAQDPFPIISLSRSLFPPEQPPNTPTTTHAATPPCHTTPCTPTTPSSAVIVNFDRSTPSPTTMSDGSLQVISLSASPDIPRLPSPWSPIGKLASPNVWLSPNGNLVIAPGPLNDDTNDPPSRPTTLSRLSTPSLCSPCSAFDAFGISVFVSLGADADAHATDTDSRNNSASLSKLGHVHDENRPTILNCPLETPKRRQTLSSITESSTTHTSRATKCFSTPLTKLDISHVRSTTSISSMAYELRMGLFSDGRSISAFENIISLLDQATPESTPPHNDSTQPTEVI